MNIVKFLSLAVAAAAVVSTSFTAQAGTSLGEADHQSAYALQIASSGDRAAVIQATAHNTRRTSVGDGNGIWAQDLTRTSSDRSRAEVRQNAIHAARAGDIQIGEATFTSM